MKKIQVFEQLDNIVLLVGILFNWSNKNKQVNDTATKKLEKNHVLFSIILDSFKCTSKKTEN